MTTDFSAGPYSARVWERVAEEVARIEQLPYLQELLDGTLEPEPFVNYLVQDEFYLDAYARAMSLLAARAGDQDQTRFWAQAAGEAITVEQQMHQDLLAEDRFVGLVERFAGRPDEGVPGTGAPDPVTHASPTALGYASFLVATAATEPYPVGVAAVLPCFWVYAHVGKVLVARAEEAHASGTRMSLDTHPYGTWIRTYDSPEFDASVVQAVGVYEKLAAEAGEGPAGDALRERMERAFVRATVFERHFWDTAHHLQNWD
ncbi:TenA family protein [Brevibacterium litoralis]|uniref:TenA family protein n=1 Tax=Brevibacterium litoralis TaxID=3138935 RepID=UPI0032EA8FAA